jgi:hypothetical protein
VAERRTISATVFTHPRLDACTGLSAAAAWAYRYLGTNYLEGTLPTELGTLTAMRLLCVRRPHPPRLDACAVTGLRAERAAAMWGSRTIYVNGITGPLPTELGNLDAMTSLCVRCPSPTVPGCVRRHRALSECGGGVGAGNYTQTVSRGRCPPSWVPWTR